MSRKVVITNVLPRPGGEQKFKATLYVDGVPDRLGSGTRCGWGATEFDAVEDLRRSGRVADAKELPIEYQ